MAPPEASRQWMTHLRTTLPVPSFPRAPTWVLRGPSLATALLCGLGQWLPPLWASLSGHEGRASQHCQPQPPRLWILSPLTLGPAQGLAWGLCLTLAWQWHCHSLYGRTIGSSSDAEQRRVQQRLTQRRADGLHITRGPGRWTRVGSPSHQIHWSAVSSCFMSSTGGLYWWVFRKTIWGSAVGDCRSWAPRPVGRPRPFDVTGTSGSGHSSSCGTACCAVCPSRSATLGLDCSGSSGSLRDSDFLESSFLLGHPAS